MNGDKIITIAEAEIGTTENPPNTNKNKYGLWFGLDGVAWCGEFVSWVYAHAGLPLGVIDYTKGYAGCPYAVKHLEKWGKLVTKPEKGDVVFFDWEGDGTFDHTGIFEKDLGNGIFCSIEGNTSIPKSGDPKEIKKANSNGGIVMRRADRKFKNAIFVRPNVLSKNTL